MNATKFAPYWLEVTVVTDGEGAEAVSEALRPFVHDGGVVLEQMGDESDPALDALETAVTVKIYISAHDDTPALRHHIEEILYHLNRLYPIPSPIFRELEEEDWANAWKAHYHPFRVGNRIWIQPSWIEPEPSNGSQPDDVVLTLDPGMAFGTGLHPTTQFCLLALEELVRPGMRLLDVGTGSAILAIAAAKLGADTIVGVDTDGLAVKTAVSNCAQNDVSDQITIRQGTLDTVPEKGWHIVVVNILAPVIMALLGEAGLMDYVAENGCLILSGILEQQRSEVETAVTKAGGKIIQTLNMRDWIAFIVQHTART